MDFNWSVQATCEHLGQIAPDEIMEFPQSTVRLLSWSELSVVLTICVEYKDLKACVGALHAASSPYSSTRLLLIELLTHSYTTPTG